MKDEDVEEKDSSVFTTGNEAGGKSPQILIRLKSQYYSKRSNSLKLLIIHKNN